MKNIVKDINSSAKNFVRDLSFKKSLLKDHLRVSIPLPYRTSLHRPIFVLGSSRSGTTMLSALLSFSPELCSFTENNIVRHNMWFMVEHPEHYESRLPYLEKILVRLSGIQSGQRLLEKTPGHSLLAEPLANYFTDAKFIHIVRNPRDVVSSMLQHEWILGELTGIHKIFWFQLLPVDFQQEWSELSPWERGILRWAVYINSAKKISSYDSRYLEISYEEFCQYPHESICNILPFLNIKSFPDLDYQLSKIKPKSVNQWKRETLTSSQSEFLNKVLSRFEINHYEWLH